METPPLPISGATSFLTLSIDGVFFGGLLLLLAFVHLRVTPSLQHKEIALPKQDG